MLEFLDFLSLNRILCYLFKGVNGTFDLICETDVIYFLWLYVCVLKCCPFL